MKKHLLSLGILLVLILNAAAQEVGFKTIVNDCWKKANEINEEGAFVKCLIGQQAPNFKAKTITGDPIELTKLRGQVVVLYFFFHSCGEPCNAQMPALNEVVKKYRFEDVEFLALADDSETELLAEFLRGREFEFKVIPEASEIIWKTFAHSIGFPALYVIDREGKIQYLTSGGSTKKEYIQPQMEVLKMAIDTCLH